MCSGSLTVENQREARLGESYCVSDGGHDGYHIGVLHLPEDGPSGENSSIKCATCIRTPTKINIVGIPQSVQDQFEIGAAITGTFRPESIDLHDWIETDDGTYLPLIELAHPSVRVEMVDVFAEPLRQERVTA